MKPYAIVSALAVVALACTGVAFSQGAGARRAGHYRSEAAC
jgi:hypothetical protein